MRVPLLILIAASVLSAALIYGEGGAAALWPAARDIGGKTAVYALIALAAALEAKKGDTGRALLILLLAVFVLRAAYLLTVRAAAPDGGESILVTTRDISALVSVLGVPILLIAKNIRKAPRSLIGLFNLAAMVSALSVAYMSVVGTLDGELSRIEGLLGILPESLFGVLLAVFYGKALRHNP